LEKIEMKKTLVAVAALAAFAGAHAEATISGVLESSIQKAAGVRSIGGGTNGTEIDIGVSEDLGSGLKAVGSVALLVNPNAGSVATSSSATHGNATSASYTSTGAVSSYNSYIGLSSSEVGTLKIGQQFSNVFLATSVGDPLGHSANSNALAGNGAGLAFQVANSLNYSSPTFAGFRIDYQKALNTSVTAQQYTSYALNYSIGSFNIAAAIGRETPTSTTKRTETALGANYDLQVVKLFVATTQQSQTNVATKSYTDLGIAVPIGAVTATANVGSGYNNLKNFGGSLTYAFSKRTSAYYSYGNGTTTANAVTQMVGIRHNF